MMHSFRLRYIVLGLLIYLQNAFCRTCGSEFDDIASKAVLATTVFEGTVVDKSLNISSSELYNATFEVIKTFKGDLPKHRRKFLQVTVGVFGPENREQCNTRVDIGSHYIVFLNTSQDASLYTISHFPELSTKTTKRELRRMLCDDCAIPVRGRVRPTEKTIKENSVLKLRCKAEGFPPPVIEWYRDDHPIKQSKKLIITKIKNVSRLRIRKTRIEDSGRYQCIIKNALGEQVVQQSIVTIESASSDSSTPGHAIRCPAESQSLCFNGGECWMVESHNGKWEQFCKCTTNYTGSRCQDKEPDIITKPDRGPIRDARQFDRTMTVLGIIIGVVLLLGVVVASYCMAKKKRREHYRRLAAKKKQQKEQQDNYTNGTHRPMSRPNDGPIDRAGAERMLINKPEGSLEFTNFMQRQRKQTNEAGIQTDFEPFYSRTNVHPHRPQNCNPSRGNSLPQQHSAPADIGFLTSLQSPYSTVPARQSPHSGLEAVPITLDSMKNKPNSTVVNAVVESEPEQRSSRSSPNQSQTSRTESAHLAFDPDGPRKPMNPESKTPMHLDEPDGDVKLPIGIDPDSQSDYENQQASDLEVNIESEADVQKLDSSDEEGRFHPDFAKLNSQHLSDDSDTDSSSAGEEHALFHNLNKKRSSSASLADNKKPPVMLNHEKPIKNEAEPLLGKSNPFVNNVRPTTFNPYANDFESSYFGNFGGPNSTSTSPYSKGMDYSGNEAELSAYLFDPDPDATPV